MKKRFLLAALCALGFGTAVYAGETQEPAWVVSQEDPGEFAIDVDTIEEMRQGVWDEYREESLADEQLQAETNEYVMTFGEAKMRYFVSIIGEKPEAGIRRILMTGSGRK